MNKKIYITESQFKEYLLEELSISNEVIDMSEEIISTIINKLENNEKEFTFNFRYNTFVDVKIFSFKNNREFSYWIDDINNRKLLINNFSFKENTFYIRCIKVNGDLDTVTLHNNVYHEVEHFFQSLKKGKPITAKKYDIITKYMNESEECNFITSLICKILYFTSKIELDAIANGFYSDLKKFDLSTTPLYDIIINTECISLLDNFKEWRNSISKWTRTPLLNQTRIELQNLNIIKFTDLNDLKKHLIKRINKSEKYLLKRIGKIYTLKKQQLDRVIEEIYPSKNNNISEGRLYQSNLILTPKTKLSKEKVFSNLNKLFEEKEK